MAASGCYIEPDRPVLANTAFVTSQTIVPSQLGGRAGADAFCNARARAAGLVGHYVAWLATGAAAATSPFHDVGGWRRVDGKPFAESTADLAAGRIYDPLRIDEYGQDVVSAEVLTNANDDGSLAIDSCNDLTGGDSVTSGVTDGTTTAWTGRLNQTSCDMPLRLYCFGDDVPTVRRSLVPAETGKLVFASSGLFAPGSGRAPADQLCADEARAAGRSGSFAALLASGTESLAPRLSGGVYVRPDHVAVTTTGHELDAPINVTLAGEYLADYMWVGAYDLERSAGPNCSDWSATTDVGFVGEASRSDSSAFGASSGAPCDLAHAVYCVEQ